MSLDMFVRASGAVMGQARDSFGTGGLALAPPPQLGEPPAAPSASGQAADHSATDSGHVQNAVSTLADHDQAGSQQLDDALNAAGAGRGRMDQIIAEALADVGDADVSTPTGQRALVDAIKRHLQDSKGTVDDAGADAGTRAAAAHTTAAGYNGVGSPSPPVAGMMPMSGMPSGGGGMPSSGMSGMSGLGSLASGLPNLLRSAAQPSAASDSSGGGADTDPAGSVAAAPLIGNDPRSVARYIYGQARAHGYSPHDALAITAYSKGESGFNPTISGGPQGGAGSENVVIGNFQEKPQFARDAGIDPAQRYTVEGNTEAYLRTLARHGNDGGDIFDHLLATSKGGPMATGGRGRMAELMGQTRDLLGGIDT